LAVEQAHRLPSALVSVINSAVFLSGDAGAAPHCRHVKPA
jgi:hypothetical protein